jgi:hypothetical protein
MWTPYGLTNFAISSPDNSSSAYIHDKTEPNEDLKFIAPNDNVNDELTPGQTWLENMMMPFTLN